LVVLLLPALLKVGSVVNYTIDYSTYLQRCENKDKPQLKCHGKCQLMKEMTQAEQAPEAPLPPDILKVEPVFFFTNDPIAPLSIAEMGIDHHRPDERSAVLKGFLSEWEVPPRV
jgi:hypothetical protein